MTVSVQKLYPLCTTVTQAHSGQMRMRKQTSVAEWPPNLAEPRRTAVLVSGCEIDVLWGMLSGLKTTVLFVLVSGCEIDVLCICGVCFQDLKPLYYGVWDGTLQRGLKKHPQRGK